MKAIKNSICTHAFKRRRHFICFWLKESGWKCKYSRRVIRLDSVCQQLWTLHLPCLTVEVKQIKGVSRHGEIWSAEHQKSNLFRLKFIKKTSLLSHLDTCEHNFSLCAGQVYKKNILKGPKNTKNWRALIHRVICKQKPHCETHGA